MQGRFGWNERVVAAASSARHVPQPCVPTVSQPSPDPLEFLKSLWGPMGLPGSTVRVTYRAMLNTVDTLSDDVSMTGLPITAYDLPVLGAAAKLAWPTEYKRNATEHQPDTRRAQEVPPGSRLGAARALQQRYEQRVTDEEVRWIIRNGLLQQLMIAPAVVNALNQEVNRILQAPDMADKLKAIGLSELAGFDDVLRARLLAYEGGAT